MATLFTEKSEDEDCLVSEQLTKKHFISIANILKSAQDVEHVRHALSDYFSQINPEFNRNVFLRVAGGRE